MNPDEPQIRGLREAATPGTPANLKRRITKARWTERRLAEQLHDHRKLIAQLIVQLDEAAGRRDAHSG